MSDTETVADSVFGGSELTRRCWRRGETDVIEADPDGSPARGAATESTCDRIED